MNPPEVKQGKMDHSRFTELVKARMVKCDTVLNAKGGEYSREGDRLWNFRVAAGMSCCSPAQALWGMLVKHLVSVRDMVEDQAKGEVVKKGSIDEKIGDVINYMMLLEGLLSEGQEGV